MMEGRDRIATGTDVDVPRNTLSDAQTSLQAHINEDERAPLLGDSESPIDDTEAPGTEPKKAWRTANVGIYLIVLTTEEAYSNMLMGFIYRYSGYYRFFCCLCLGLVERLCLKST